MSATDVESSDQTIESLEAELRESQFKAWDVESFLANRHQAKIDALTTPREGWKRHWQFAKEFAGMIFSIIGVAATAALSGHWLLTGNFIP